ncbi:hypothetical protein EDD11_002680 [Mortierella claussenii]|nr:hypothetical protein EDD11_002680 [Mortierella claussenii]
MSFLNRNAPLLIAIGVGVLSGLYIWEPSLKQYQRESKGTWNYDVVKQTRAEEMNEHADQVAGATASTTHGSSPSTPAAGAPSSAAPTAPVSAPPSTPAPTLESKAV